MVIFLFILNFVLADGPRKEYIIPEQLDSHAFDAFVYDSETQLLRSEISDKPWFVKFYAPWCTHCQALAPVWDLLRKEVSDKVNVVRVDCTDGKENQELCRQFNIKGFPTLLLLADDKYHKYKGQRDISSLKLFAQEGYKNSLE